MRQKNGEREARSEERAGRASEEELSLTRVGEPAHDEQVGFDARRGLEQCRPDILAPLPKRLEPCRDVPVIQDAADFFAYSSGCNCLSPRTVTTTTSAAVARRGIASYIARLAAGVASQASTAI